MQNKSFSVSTDNLISALLSRDNSRIRHELQCLPIGSEIQLTFEREEDTDINATIIRSTENVWTMRTVNTSQASAISVGHINFLVKGLLFACTIMELKKIVWRQPLQSS